MSTPASPEDVADLVRQMMEAYATDAVDAVRANYDIELDFSPESIKTVEEILGRIAAQVRRALVPKAVPAGSERRPGGHDLQDVRWLRW